VAALEGLARRAREVDGLQLALGVAVEEDALDPELKTAVYRLVQEALTNVARHAAASSVVVTVAQEPGGVELRVADDGRGFDEREPTVGFRLAGMRSAPRSWAGGWRSRRPAPARS
jgi:signal transduction histidine kinase